MKKCFAKRKKKKGEMISDACFANPVFLLVLFLQDFSANCQGRGGDGPHSFCQLVLFWFFFLCFGDPFLRLVPRIR